MPTPSDPLHRRALFFILLAAVVGGVGPVLIKITLQEIPPLSFTFLRFVLATLPLLPLWLKKRHPISKRDALWLVGLSLLAAANVVLFSFGVQRTSATAASMMYAAVPLIAGILSVALLKEQLGIKKICGLLIGLGGVLTIVLLPVWEGTRTLTGTLLGNAIIICGVLLFALYSVLSKRFQKTFPPLTLTLFFALTTVGALLPFLSLDVIHHPGWWQNITMRGIAGLLFVGIAGTGLYYLAYQYAIKHATPTVASMILYLQPICTFIWATLLLGERLSLPFIGGSALAFVGVWLVTQKVRPTPDIPTFTKP